MKRSLWRAVLRAACGLLLVPALGCALAADLVNPDFLTQLGLDPGTVIPPPGRVVVAFNNTTSQSVTFYAYFVEDAGASRGGNLTSVVPAGETRSEAVDCPFVVLSPGRLNANFAVDTNAAAVGDPGQQTLVPYAGSVLVSGRDFICGDLIEIRVVQTGGDDGQGGGAFEVRVQVYPGR